jgi:hypothetical protein
MKNPLNQPTSLTLPSLYPMEIYPYSQTANNLFIRNYKYTIKFVSIYL